MAPLPSNLTQRLFLTYTSIGKEHVLELRPPGVQSPTTLASMAAGAANELRAFMFTSDSFTKAEYTGIGSNVRFPLTFAAVGGVVSAAGNIYADDPESVQLSVTGKGLNNGVRWSARFFTAYNWASSPWPDTNRWSRAAAPTGVQNFYDVYAGWYQSPGLTGIQLVCAGSTPVILNTYVNICHNAWWQRAQR